MLSLLSLFSTLVSILVFFFVGAKYVKLVLFAKIQQLSHPYTTLKNVFPLSLVHYITYLPAPMLEISPRVVIIDFSSFTASRNMGLPAMEEGSILLISLLCG